MRIRTVLIGLVVILVGAYAFSGFFQETIPDLNEPTLRDVPYIGYARINASLAVVGTTSCAMNGACNQTVSLIPGSGKVGVDEFLNVPAQPATVASGFILTAFGEDCFAKLRMAFVTPDETGTGDSKETKFVFNQSMIFQFGNLYMFHQGQVRISLDVYVRGCGATTESGSMTYPDWTRVTGTGEISFTFDGVDQQYG